MTENKQARALYRLELVWAITGKRELWSNYLDQRTAEEKAHSLIADGMAGETEVFAVTEGHKTSIYHARLERDGAITVWRNSQ
ncbi:MAG: hypothetical protein JMDDDDMK_00742 [Acidobacteria bacterium]|nr:hypothetical protein [Acidobacteriota bacterium]